LDVARKTYCSTTEAIQELGASTAASSGLTLKVVFAPRGGFTLKCPAAEYEAAPAEVKAQFVRVNKKGRVMSCMTAELAALNSRLLDSQKDSLLLSQSVVDSVSAAVRHLLPALTAVSEAVSLLDMLVNGFAATVAGSQRPYTRPRFTIDGPLALENARHPVSCAEPGGGAVVPNSVFLSDSGSYILVTGANGAGKTTYLKTIAVAVVLAHCGCYVPCDWASVRLTDKLLTRLSARDDVESQTSTFLVECRELATMLHGATRNSLCIIDELGRATSTGDGYAIAMAAAEHLLSVGAFTLCATHFERLAELGALYSSVKHAHLRVVPVGDCLKASHELTEGASTLKLHYGLTLAASGGLPQPLVARAQEVVAILERKTAAMASSTPGVTVYSLSSLLLAQAQAPGPDARQPLRALRDAAIQLAQASE
jgi:DNA mismatch repair protein MSH4